MKVINQYLSFFKLSIIFLISTQLAGLSAQSPEPVKHSLPQQANLQQHVEYISPLSLKPIKSPELIQGSYIIAQLKAKPVTDYQVLFNEQSVTVDPLGYFIFGVGRDELQAELKILHNSGVVHQQNFTVEKRQYAIQRIDGLEPSKVNPIGEQVLARIRSEAGKVYQARQIIDFRKDFLAGFIWPAKGPISGVYGSQRVLNGEPKRPHFGVDIAGPVGTDIVAPASGIVRLVHDDMYYSGGTLIIDHGHGLSSTFLHLSELLVSPGEQVTQGQLVAKMGKTGRATGSHLDWRLNWFNVRLDPQLVVSGSPEN